MITELTQEQIDFFPQYVEKYIKIGLSTERIDKEKCIQYANEIMTKILGRNELPVVFADSPFSAWIFVNIFSNKDIYKSAQELAQWMRPVRLIEQGEANTPDVMFPLEHDGYFLSIIQETITSMLKNIPNRIYKGKEPMEFLERCIKNMDKNFVWPYIDGHFFAHYFGFYDYMNKVLGIELNELYFIYRNSLNFGLFYPLEKVVIITDRPCKIKTLNGQLHADGETCVEYPDGWGFYALHGVNVSKNVAVTPADELSCDLILSEKNAEVRRELIRKIGHNRMLKELNAKVIDKRNEYELLSINKINNEERLYLKMTNPSTGLIHVEAVPRECQTVLQALAVRNEDEGDYEEPLILV